MRKKLSVVVSCYNEEKSLPLFYKEINRVSKIMKYLNFEFIFIDDGSVDKTLDIIKNIIKKIRELDIYHFLEILVKKLLCMLDLN